MDGIQLVTKMRQLLEEDEDSGFVNSLLSYQFINDAALDFVNRTKCLRTDEDITTVADQAEYDLSPDFSELYVKDRYRRYVIKLKNGSANTMITQSEYEDFFFASSDSGSVSHFAIQNKDTSGTNLTGTASAVGAESGGECTLTDTVAAQFATVEVGDSVHNTTDESDGVVIEVTSSSVIVTALFNGTDDDWTSADAYVIVPQGRMQLVLEQPPDTAGYTLTVPYIQRPNQLYSKYRTFKFPVQYHDVIVMYAAWLYKYKDREPQYGDKWYVLYDQQAKAYSAQLRKSFKDQTLKINLNARRSQGYY